MPTGAGQPKPRRKRNNPKKKKKKKKKKKLTNKNRNCASFYGPSSSGIPCPLKHKIPHCSRNTLPWTRKKIQPPGTYNTINRQAWFMHQAQSLTRSRICSDWAPARIGDREDERQRNKKQVESCTLRKDFAGRRIVDQPV
ncbi:hypothetical protein BO83DRAFT_124198 [Aspergillus eucalypticola CBS 122712]|uniref:Uncharacterized protein n=1 Tax=Aspergillus eucalypticola (strain CBS 122712 / IBT 29274) TaxID=1448314 RepID=A0A317UVV8_ASPEC|nr:uncharacterized protein BO83DRAFT_124198 [Aspergillus eucalypticola CBS 122712]PWY65168.1 hypothetical protein BO83DRAFT_124198 [Aspergillus eucalypticola CBS 122712]